MSEQNVKVIQDQIVKEQEEVKESKEDVKEANKEIKKVEKEKNEELRQAQNQEEKKQIHDRYKTQLDNLKRVAKEYKNVMEKEIKDLDRIRRRLENVPLMRLAHRRMLQDDIRDVYLKCMYALFCTTKTIPQIGRELNLARKFVRQVGYAAKLELGVKGTYRKYKYKLRRFKGDYTKIDMLSPRAKGTLRALEMRLKKGGKRLVRRKTTKRKTKKKDIKVKREIRAQAKKMSRDIVSKSISKVAVKPKKTTKRKTKKKAIKVKREIRAQPKKAPKKKGKPRGDRGKYIRRQNALKKRAKEKNIKLTQKQISTYYRANKQAFYEKELNKILEDIQK